MIADCPHGRTHRITESGATWLQLIGTDTRYDGYCLAYCSQDPLPQLMASIHRINVERTREHLRPVIVVYEGKSYW